MGYGRCVLILLLTFISDRTFGLGRMQGKRSSTASGH